MAWLLRSRYTVIWLALVGATLLSWALGGGAGDDKTLAASGIILVSLIKVRYVVLDFMELRRAPKLMRLVAELWISLLAIVLVTMLWVELPPVS